MDSGFRRNDIRGVVGAGWTMPYSDLSYTRSCRHTCRTSDTYHCGPW